VAPLWASSGRTAIAGSSRDVEPAIPAFVNCNE
jgi:hypothetical protein